MADSKRRPVAITVRVAVTRLNDRFIEHRSSISRDAGLTYGEFNALVILAQRPGGITLGELARMLAVKAPNLTVTARNLESKGLAKRVASHDDKRSASLHLTGAGDALLKRALPEDDRILADALARLNEDEIEVLSRLLRKMTE